MKYVQEARVQEMKRLQEARVQETTQIQILCDLDNQSIHLAEIIFLSSNKNKLEYEE